MNAVSDKLKYKCPRCGSRDYSLNKFESKVCENCGLAYLSKLEESDKRIDSRTTLINNLRAEFEDIKNRLSVLEGNSNT